MKAPEIYEMIDTQYANPEVEKHYARFNNPSKEIITALSKAYTWGDLYDMLTGPFGLDWYDEACFEFRDEIAAESDADWWRFTADAIEDIGCPFGRIVLALDMYVNGMFNDEADDSIGRMEDYESEMEAC